MNGHIHNQPDHFEKSSEVLIYTRLVEEVLEISKDNDK